VTSPVLASMSPGPTKSPARVIVIEPLPFAAVILPAPTIRLSASMMDSDSFPPVTLALIVATFVPTAELFWAVSSSTFPAIVPETVILPPVAERVTFSLPASISPGPVRFPAARLIAIAPLLVTMSPTPTARSPC